MRVRHARTIAAPPQAVWAVVADPARLAEWWPGVTRVEEVGESSWTTVLTSSRGKSVRADHTLLVRDEEERVGWRHEVAASPFERILKDSRTSVTLEPEDGGTRVSIEMDQTPRGWARLGIWQLRAATSRQVRGALDGLERAVPPTGQD